MVLEHNRASLPEASKRDGLIKTGYNSGFIKGTFATQFDSKEYFQMFIRPKNAEKFGEEAREEKHMKAKARYIVQERDKKEEF